jgi:xanthine dehydrogenase accessory factor
MAAEAFISKKSRIAPFVLSSDDKEDLGMICGGTVTVYIQYVSALDENARELFNYAADQFSKNVNSWLVTDITDESEWRMTLLTTETTTGSPLPDGLPEQVFSLNRCCHLECAGRKYYAEPLTRAERVYIFGGGHISQELIPLLSHTGFSCTVFDNLPKFASKDLFSAADSAIVGNFDAISSYVTITENDYVIILTRGHSYDLIVQAQALRLKPRYIGVIGSRSKIAAVSQKLIEMGFSQEEIDTVHTPIGIPIKADTPAEIAVSIAAELIMTRAGSLRPLG